MKNYTLINGQKINLDKIDEIGEVYTFNNIHEQIIGFTITYKNGKIYNNYKKFLDENNRKILESKFSKEIKRIKQQIKKEVLCEQEPDLNVRIVVRKEFSAKEEPTGCDFSQVKDTIAVIVGLNLSNYLVLLP